VIDHTDPANFTAVKIVNRNESSQFIFQSVDREKSFQNTNWKFRGSFGVVGVKGIVPEYLYLGEGNEIGYNNYSLKINDSTGAAFLQVNRGRLKIECRQETLVTIPAANIRKITLATATAQKNLIYLLNDDDTISFTIPAVTDADIIIK
jgi:hypothetical protein